MLRQIFYSHNNPRHASHNLIPSLLQPQLNFFSILIPSH
jgi:hypothetical protein